MSSPSDMIINGLELDCSQLTFSKPKVTATGGKSVNIINSATKKGLYLTTPLMFTWGMNENDYDGNGKKTQNDTACQNKTQLSKPFKTRKTEC